MKYSNSLCKLLLFSLLLFTLPLSAKIVEVEFNAAHFPSPPNMINNTYWPLLVGDSYGYMAIAEDECEFNKLIVTSDTLDIEVSPGVFVETRVIRDQEWVTEQDEEGECDLEEAQLVEDTFDFYAQDNNGHLWYFGEDTWAWDDDEEACTDEGSWIAGEPVGDPEVDPAMPGIVMLASPQSGDRYQQEFLEEEAEDWAAILRLNAEVSIEFGDMSDCLVTKEWTPLEPGEVEHKYYCPPIGLVFIEELKEKNLYVEYIDPFPEGLPGDNSFEFPADALGCAD